MSVRIFDADEHYYEAKDAFTRFASARMNKEKLVRWVTEADGKRKRLLAGSQVADIIGNPTFNPIALPGSQHEMLKKLEAGNNMASIAYDQVEPLRAEYRDRDVRLRVMREQGVERTMMFPTLGVTMEGNFYDDVELLYDAIHAFNRWQEEDWGFVRYLDEFEGSAFADLRAQAGDARVSIQEMVAFIPRGGDREAIGDVAMRRFGYARPAIGTGPELVEHFQRRAQQGVERVYAWFCDFAQPETLAGFGEEVIGKV